MVRFLEKKGNSFTWPEFEDDTLTEAHNVFKWDFDVLPTGTHMQQWNVAAIEEISEAFHSLK